MVDHDALVAELVKGYGFEDESIVLGRALAGDLETPITSARNTGMPARDSCSA